MFAHEFHAKRTVNGYVLTGKVWVSLRPTGGHHVTPQPGQTLKIVRGSKTRDVKASTPVVLWIDPDHNLCWEDQPPVPALTKEQGMVLAYTHETPDREMFEALLYEFCQGSPQGFVFSANNIWELWRARGFPEPKKRAFVGPTMQHGEKARWMVFDSMVQNTQGHAHSGLPNRGYRSLIIRAIP